MPLLTSIIIIIILSPLLCHYLYKVCFKYGINSSLNIDLTEENRLQTG